jgi:hypothetical protein
LWKIENKLIGYDGYLFGAKYPCIILTITGQEISANEQRALMDALKLYEDKRCRAGFENLTWPKSIIWLIDIWHAVQQLNGLPVFESGRILSQNQQQAKCMVMVSQQTHVAVANMIAARLQWLASKTKEPEDEHCVKTKEQITKSINGLIKQAPKGSNVPRFIKAAFELNIPTLWLPGNVVQFGQGSRARRLDSSFTDQTPLVSAKWARNKLWASTMLAKSGLPVAAHQIVSSSDEAI